jgi:hypothetical protein
LKQSTNLVRPGLIGREKPSSKKKTNTAQRKESHACPRSAGRGGRMVKAYQTMGEKESNW